jgi:hypothetical protein
LRHTMDFATGLPIQRASLYGCKNLDCLGL